VARGSHATPPHPTAGQAFLLTRPRSVTACPPPQVRYWRGFARAELWYIILSLTSKQLLAWITYGGTKRFE